MSQPYISDKILRFLSDTKKTAKVLDIATWQWYLLEILNKEWFLELYGADISSVNFKLDKNIYNFSQINANKELPYVDNFFDVIISSETIEHVQNPIFFLEELYRILKKDGIFILTTPNVETIFSKIYFLLTWWLAGHTYNDYIWNGHITILTSQLIDRFTNKIWFKSVNKTYNSFYIPWLRLFSRNLWINKLFGCVSIYKFVK